MLPADWTFAIWGPIYLAFLGYAVYQLLPAQRGREVHRATGWWLAVSAVLNAGVDPRVLRPGTCWSPSC